MSFEAVDTYVVDGIKVSILKFQLPLDYSNPETSIDICVKLVNNRHSDQISFCYQTDLLDNIDKVFLYLEGGPGYESAFPVVGTVPTYLSALLDKGYTVILLDQRGTGLSSPLQLSKLTSFDSPEEQLEFLNLFRADSIVNDCEQIRRILLGEQKWSLLGQSYGGFCSTCYCSRFPDSIKKVFITGGLPPLTGTVEQVATNNLTATKRKTLEYYAEFPNDEHRIARILDYLATSCPTLPNGGTLSRNRFQHLGTYFGASGGFTFVHKLVTTMTLELDSTGQLSYKTLELLQNCSGFETNLLHFLYQENIYMNGPGKSTNWTVERVKKQLYGDKFFFTSEHHYSELCNDYHRLQSLKPLLDLLHSTTDWRQIWNIETLKTFTPAKLPIYCMVFYDDQYVSTELSLANETIFPFKRVITSEFLHDGVKSNGHEVLDKLFQLSLGNYIR
ncbi:hypothetical protein OGAPHI_001874 [Ogataea philodendri]|uniref:AB hydrolase-1 domain-containing protein n=1 Tax=Ogataea philodendri TaxID=1378263 RepID=A0A9P8T7F4_9ASCO|nr:uncharacterized protein OGAPHI_001874 [Ogataea philodendri]KAH3668120.1 hypothetical protein OGAPHI_001874 [Ogataea philodendri]